MKNFKYLSISFLIIFSQSTNSFAAEAKVKKELSQEEQKKFSKMMWQGIIRNNKDLVQEALNNGINPDTVKNEQGSRVLSFAANQGYEDLIKILLDAGANPDIQNKFGKTALMAASMTGHQNIVRQLLDAGANPNIIDDEGTNALDDAIKNNYIEIAKMLLDAQEKRRQAVKKEIIESTTLLPDLAEISAEYAECPKPKRGIVEE